MNKSNRNKKFKYECKVEKNRKQQNVLIITTRKIDIKASARLSQWEELFVFIKSIRCNMSMKEKQIPIITRILLLLFLDSSSLSSVSNNKRCVRKMVIIGFYDSIFCCCCFFFVFLHIRYEIFLFFC